MQFHRKYLSLFLYFCVKHKEQLGSMLTKLSQKNLESFNECSKDMLRDSLEKIRISNQKLMVYQVLTSKQNIFTTISPEANTLTKRVLGVNTQALESHPNSNLRAFSYVLVQALTQNSLSLQTVKEVNQKLILLKQNPPKIVNYLISEKFKPNEMLQIFAAMQSKIVDLVEGGLVVNEIIKVYSCYLDLTSFFLRSLLSNVGMASAEDSQQKLPTNEIYSILSEYLDLSYLVNKNLFLFPDIKAFIASPDDKQFVFGRYYENSQDLKKNQSEIRQSTIDYLNKGNQSMKISKINLDITMSQFMFPDKFTEFPGVSSKAPTPQFGQGQFHGFEQMLGYNSDQQCHKLKFPKQQNQKQTKPETTPQVPPQTDQDPDQPANREDEISRQFKKLHRESVFTQNLFNQQIMTPAATGKNIIGSAFYLHQFDFYHRTNKEHDQLGEKFCSQRVLLKGSSMVEKGQLFLQQVGELKKQIENQMSRKNKNSNLHESISAQTLNQNERRSKNASPFSQNVKSEVHGDNKSAHSEISKKMALNSEVYRVNIEQDDRSKSKGKPVNKSKDNTKNKTVPYQNYSRSTSKNKPGKGKQFVAIPLVRCKASAELYHSPRIQKPKPILKNYVKPLAYRGSEAPQLFSSHQNPRYSNQNHNHIHIHIHNDNKTSQNDNKSFHMPMPVKIQRHPKQTDIHYEINDNNLQHAFESAIPEIIKQIQTHNGDKQYRYRNCGRNQAGFAGKKEFYCQAGGMGQADKFFGLAKSEKLISSLAKNNFVKVKTLNNMQSEKLLSNERSLNLKKIKSEDGINKPNQQSYRHQPHHNPTPTPNLNLNLPQPQPQPQLKQPKKGLHVPSFLKKKQTVKNDKDDSIYSVNKSVQRNNSKSLKINTPVTNMQKEANSSSYGSPRPVMSSKEKIGVGSAKKKFEINMNGKYFGKCSTDLETPTFCSPQNPKHR